MKNQKITAGPRVPVFNILGCLALGVVTLVSSFSRPAAADSDVPLVVQAIKAAASVPANSYVQATVTLSTLGSATNQPKSIVAQGKVTLVDNQLQGRLPMSFDATYRPGVGSQTLFFKVSRRGRIGLQWLINGVARDGEAVKSFDLDANGQALSRRIEWAGMPWMATVTFETRQANQFVPIIVGTIKLKEPDKLKDPLIITKPVKVKPKKPVIIGDPIIVKVPRKPVGRKVRISARLLVTNSSDGVGDIWGSSDNSVELAGYISLGNNSLFSFNNRSAQQGDEFTKTIDSLVLRYDDPDLRFYSLKGKVWDRDKASSSDTLFMTSQRLDLLKIMESNREYLVKGDRKSENADLYLRVTDLGEVY